MSKAFVATWTAIVLLALSAGQALAAPERTVVVTTAQLDGVGTNFCDREVAIAGQLVQTVTTWTDAKGGTHTITQIDYDLTYTDVLTGTAYRASPATDTVTQREYTTPSGVTVFTYVTGGVLVGDGPDQIAIVRVASAVVVGPDGTLRAEAGTAALNCAGDPLGS